jgi:two-component system sensor histidine kinase KdpD
MAVAVRHAKMRAQAENLRDALIGSVSHELRTPLAGIIGSTSVLAQSPAIAQDQSLASLVLGVRREAERLNGDIQNLLDATRISSDGIMPNWEWVDPEDVVNGALARKRNMLGRRPVTRAIADDLPLIYVDPSLIESALGQLIENAANYSPVERPITIAAAQEGETIHIKVADQGIGLAPGEFERIFERFYRGTRHVNSVAGSGLGLWIARALVEACGGRIRAFSGGLDEGTTVRIDLPLKPQPASDEEADE